MWFLDDRAGRLPGRHDARRVLPAVSVARARRWARSFGGARSAGRRLARLRVRRRSRRCTALRCSSSGERAATAAVWLLATFPTAFFLTAVYSESLFLALCVGSVYAARTDRWWLGRHARRGSRRARAAPASCCSSPWSLLWLDPGPAAGRDVLAAARAGPGRPAPAYCAGLALAGRDGARAVRRPGAVVPRVRRARSSGSGTAPRPPARARASCSPARATPVYFTQAGGDPFVVAAHNLELFATLLAARAHARRGAAAPAARLRRVRVAALALPLSYPVGPQPLMSLPRFVLVLFPLFMWLGLVGVAPSRLARAGRCWCSAVAARSPSPSSRPGTGSHDRRSCSTRSARSSSSRTRRRRSRRSLPPHGAQVAEDEARAAVRRRDDLRTSDHHDEGWRPLQRLADLRRRCAEVLRDKLPPQRAAARPRDGSPPPCSPRSASAPFPEALPSCTAPRDAPREPPVRRLQLGRVRCTSSSPRPASRARRRRGVRRPRPAPASRIRDSTGGRWPWRASRPRRRYRRRQPGHRRAGALALGIRAVLVDRWGAPSRRRARPIASLAEVPALVATG